jgi:superfamily I DNA/RNA helicase
MTHAGYLKLYQLQIGPEELALKYDAIMLDEAQDLNPVRKPRRECLDEG